MTSFPNPLGFAALGAAKVFITPPSYYPSSYHSCWCLILATSAPRLFVIRHRKLVQHPEATRPSTDSETFPHALISALPTPAMAAVDNFATFMTTADIDSMDNWGMAMPPAEPVIPVPTPADQSILDELSLLAAPVSASAQQAPQSFIPQQQAPHMHHIPQQPHHNAHHLPHQQTILDIDQVPQYHPTTTPGVPPQISSPVTPTCSAPLPSPLKRKAHGGLSSLAPHAKRRDLLSSFGTARAKTEPLLVSEPLTPSSSHRALHPLNTLTPSGPAMLPMANVTLPAASASESSCSDEDEAGPHFSPNSPLPAPSAAAAAKRRQARSRLLAASRARAAAKTEPTVATAGSECGSGASSAVATPGAAGADEDAEPVDKKVARAIRNRQAAQRSRVEAKAKMAKLADDNVGLATEVEKLTAENASLNKQLEQLMQATFGDGAKIDEVLELFKAAKESRS